MDAREVRMALITAPERNGQSPQAWISTNMTPTKVQKTGGGREYTDIVEIGVSPGRVNLEMW